MWPIYKFVWVLPASNRVKPVSKANIWYGNGMIFAHRFKLEYEFQTMMSESTSLQAIANVRQCVLSISSGVLVFALPIGRYGWDILYRAICLHALPFNPNTKWKASEMICSDDWMTGHIAVEYVLIWAQFTFSPLDHWRPFGTAADFYRAFSRHQIIWPTITNWSTAINSDKCSGWPFGSGHIWPLPHRIRIHRAPVHRRRNMRLCWPVYDHDVCPLKGSDILPAHGPNSSPDQWLICFDT